MEGLTQMNEKLAYLYSNGKGEAGLEAGADAGLAVNEYIRIPKSAAKKWAARIRSGTWKKVGINPDDVLGYNEGDKPEKFIDQVGWITTGKMRIHKNKHEVTLISNGTRMWVEIDKFIIEPQTVEDMKRFYTVNVDHIKDNEIPTENHFWVHAVRMWAVFGGLVTSDKNTEYLIVDDPIAYDINSDDFVNFAISYSVNAWTAAAARTTSWKKTNHATGGTPAMGLPRRWMNKEGIWPTSTSSGHEREKLVTSAFYVATHAIAVHAVLAQFTPEDEHHWCVLNPEFGMIMEWNIGESVKIRMNPREQVAGVSMVTDSIVVLKMLVSEGLAPVLENITQAPALCTALETVKQNGMACGVYKKWFFSGYPGNIPDVNFSQRDPAYFDLISELAIIATKFYYGSTIAQSPTLKNVAAQSSFENLKSIWATASSVRPDLSGTDLSNMVNLVRGSAIIPYISHIVSTDPKESNSGRERYNEQMDFLSRLVGLQQTKRLELHTI